MLNLVALKTPTVYYLPVNLILKLINTVIKYNKINEWININKWINPVTGRIPIVSAV